MNLRDHILAVIGVGVFIICVLACRPAFSPDGKKVVLPVFEVESKQTTVMLYDRETRRVERIFTRPHQNDQVYASAVWTPDGKHVVTATVQAESDGGESRGPFRREARSDLLKLPAATLEDCGAHDGVG